MRNTNKTNKPKMIIIALIAISLIVWVYHTLEQNKSIAEANETQRLTQMELDIAKKPSKIEIIQKQIESGKKEILYNREFRDEATRIYEASVWYVRCLEKEGENELSGTGELKCIPYQLAIPGETSDEAYEFLKQFANWEQGGLQ